MDSDTNINKDIASTPAAGPAALLLCGLPFVALGCWIIGTATGIFPLTGTLYVSRAVFAAAGGAFLCMGLLIWMITWVLAGRGLTTRKSFFVKTTLSMFISCIAVVFCYIGFGRGERTFSVKRVDRINEQTVISERPFNAATGRLIFGAGGAIAALVATAAWWTILFAPSSNRGRGVP